VLDRLGRERSEVESELRRVQQILDVATSGGHDAVAGASGRGAVREPAQPRAARAPADNKAAIAQAQDAFRDPAETGAFDELAFLKSVVDTPRGASGSHAAVSAADAKDAAESRPPAGGTAPPGGAAPRAAAPTPRGVEPGERGSTTRRPSLESVPAFLKDVPSEQVKTLRCQECGTMNYPTEWYCERCGGELAAM
jgi:hypothetical protein